MHATVVDVAPALPESPRRALAAQPLDGACLFRAPPQPFPCPLSVRNLDDRGRGSPRDGQRDLDSRLSPFRLKTGESVDAGDHVEVARLDRAGGLTLAGEPDPGCPP